MSDLIEITTEPEEVFVGNKFKIKARVKANIVNMEGKNISFPNGLENTSISMQLKGESSQETASGNVAIDMATFDTMSSSGMANTYDNTTHTITFTATAQSPTSISGRYKRVPMFEIGKTYIVSADIKGTAGKTVSFGFDTERIEITLTENYVRHSSTHTATRYDEAIDFYMRGVATGNYLQFANITVTEVAKAINLCPPLIYSTRVNPTTGASEVNVNAGATDFIPVDFNTNSSYYVSCLTKTLNSFVAAYNSNKEFLGRTAASSRIGMAFDRNSFTSGTPSGTGDIAYIRITQYSVTNLAGTRFDLDGVKPMLNPGTEPLPYAPYSQGYKAPSARYELPIKSVTGHNEVEIRGENLFDRENAYEDMILTWAKGITNAEAGGIASDFIDIQNIDYIISNYKFHIFYYNQNKTYIGNSSDMRITTGTAYNSVDVMKSSYARYIRLSFRSSTNNNVDMTTKNIMVNTGTTLLPYIAFHKQLLPLDLSTKNICTNSRVINNNYLGFTADKKYLTNEFVLSFITDSATENNSVYAYKNGTSLDWGIIGRITGSSNQRASGIVLLSDEQLGAIKTTEDTYEFRVYKSGANWTTVTNAQIENGGMLTDYVANADYDYEFNKIKDYRDYFLYDRTNDKWYKREYIKKYTFNGTELWSNQTGRYDTATRMMFDCSSSILSVFPTGMENRKTICNYFNCYNMEDPSYSVQSTRDITACNFHRLAQYANNFYVKLERSLLPAESEAGMKQWVKNLYDNGHPLIVWGQLAEPNMIEITAPTLIAQLNAIQAMHPYQKETIISTYCNNNTEQATIKIVALAAKEI